MRRPFLALCLLALLPFSAVAQIFMSPDEAKQLGAQEHPKVLKEFGGAFDDPEIGAYVASIAGRLAGQSGLPAGDFHFTVLNSPVVNAFALPGGYVYITRGTLALANNEAEAGAVLGHEIGHVVAKHSEQRYDKSIFTNLGVAGASILGSIFLGQGAGEVIGQLGGAAGGAYLAGFSRENEFEADLIGLQLLGRVGYAPDAAAGFLQSLSDYSELETKAAGQAGRDRTMDLFATHPRGPDRVQAAIEAARSQPAHPIYRRDEYLDRINGLIYGDDPKEGVVRGTSFTHPGLRLAFSVPEGWRISNTSDAVVARSPAGNAGSASLQFDIERDKRKVQASRGALDYLTRIWLPKQRLSNAEAIQVGGMPGATARARVQTKDGSTVDARFVAVGFPTDDILRFVLLAPPRLLPQVEGDVIRAVNTVRHLSAEEAARVQPLRLKVITAQSGDTIESLAQRMPPGRFQIERFRVLNGYRDGETVQPGQRVKLVQ